MAYDHDLADRIRQILASHEGVSEKKMFGGISFMLGGNMCCGVVRNDLVVRVGPERHDEALAQPHARPMDFTGRPLRGLVYVGPGAYQADDTLRTWVKRGVDFAESLPPK
jgi:TfoX/Sxy family transcriptional regulator of competence genes